MPKIKILLCVTGSIAAYKAPEVLRLLQKKGSEVKVVMTKSAMDFITPLTFQALTGEFPYHVISDDKDPMIHITLAKWADKIVISPASSSTIAKLARGISEDLIVATCVASDRPIYLSPAMNKQMWYNEQNQQNIKNLEAIGVKIIGPVDGAQACGDEGVGAMSTPEEIVNNVLCKEYKGKVIVTAGPTREPIDPVRYISNHSSGKFGYAIAETFEEYGYKVHLCSGPTSIRRPFVSQITMVETAEEMFEAVMSDINGCDVFIAAAAVGDYKAANYSNKKLKKTSNQLFAIELLKNPDILSAVSELENRPFVVGFAAETHDLYKNAKSKLINKGADLIVANEVSINNMPFSSDVNKVSFITEEQELHFERQSKCLLAIKLLEFITGKMGR